MDEQNGGRTVEPVEDQPIVRSGESGIIPDEPVVDDRPLRGVPIAGAVGSSMGPAAGALLATGGVLGGGAEDPAMEKDQDVEDDLAGGGV
jgi:hypothetical protein